MGTRDDSSGRTVRAGRRHHANTIVVSPNDTDHLLNLNVQRFRKITPRDIGLLERIAHAYFDVANLSEAAVSEWEAVHTQFVNMREVAGGDITLMADSVIQPIAQSVAASSDIEDEGLQYYASVEHAILGRPDAEDPEHGPEMDRRIRGVRAIYGAYLWALAHEFPLQGGYPVTPAFIAELHKRMFASTRAESAGRIKSAPNEIEWKGKGIVLAPLAPERTDEFLKAICTRLRKTFQLAAERGGYSKLIAVAEFILDLLAVHPFDDGNGRLARLLSTYLLERAGFRFVRFASLDDIILERRAEYYAALNESQRGWGTADEDLTPWIRFYLEAVYTQMMRARERLLRIKDKTDSSPGSLPGK